MTKLIMNILLYYLIIINYKIISKDYIFINKFIINVVKTNTKWGNFSI